MHMLHKHSQHYWLIRSMCVVFMNCSSVSPLWLVPSLDAGGAVALGRRLVPVPVTMWCVVAERPVKVVRVSWGEPWPGWLCVSYNAAVVDLVAVAFPVCVALITVALHQRQRQSVVLCCGLAPAELMPHDSPQNS